MQPHEQRNIAAINLGAFGSTGTIMKGIHEAAIAQGASGIMAVPASRKNGDWEDLLIIGGERGRRLSNYASIITGLDGCFSVFATAKFLRALKKRKVALLHLHNLHYSYINLPMLFRFIKKNNIKVLWTFHDCWPFTGHCPHFSYNRCEKWKDGCYSCPRYGEYPKTVFDNSRGMWRRKKRWFTGVKDMTIITPSRWLADLVKQSFLKEYPVKVIPNGIDLTVFHPVESDFRRRFSLEDKKIVLGVSFGWGEKKGLDVFAQLAKRLPEDYRIVLVGTSPETEQQLPPNVISIHRTENQRELAEIYTAADVFVNPTREDTYPTVNMEALACGTPVITFQTGGSPESLDEACGVVVACDDVAAMEEVIVRVCEQKPYTKQACLKRAESFDKNARFKEYVQLYGNAGIAADQADF